MKTRVIFGIIFILWALLFTKSCVEGYYEYELEIGTYWDLADRASTVENKTVQIDQFIQALENSGLKGKHAALIFETPSNSFDSNLEAVKSLQSRLHEISIMDVTAVEYQIAMQQITAQEQGEASNMLNVFRSTWWKEHHIFTWDWIGVINLIFGIFLFFGFIAIDWD